LPNSFFFINYWHRCIFKTKRPDSDLVRF